MLGLDGKKTPKPRENTSLSLCYNEFLSKQKIREGV